MSSREASKKAAKELLALCAKEGVKVPTDPVNAAVEAGTMLNATREDGEFQLDAALQEMIKKFGVKKVASPKKKDKADVKEKKATRGRKRKSDDVKDEDEDEDEDEKKPKKPRKKVEATCEANQALADAFAELSDLNSSAAKDITCGKDALKLKGVGKSSAAKIDEFIETGTLEKLDEYRAGNILCNSRMQRGEVAVASAYATPTSNQFDETARAKFAAMPQHWTPPPPPRANIQPPTPPPDDQDRQFSQYQYRHSMSMAGTGNKRYNGNNRHKKPRQTCMKFLSGYGCSYGDKCRFSHDLRAFYPEYYVHSADLTDLVVMMTPFGLQSTRYPVTRIKTIHTDRYRSLLPTRQFPRRKKNLQMRKCAAGDDVPNPAHIDFAGFCLDPKYLLSEIGDPDLVRTERARQPPQLQQQQFYARSMSAAQLLNSYMTQGQMHSNLNFVDTKLASMELHQQQAIDSLQELVRSLWPDAIIDIYGSSYTRLALPASDIDCVLVSRTLAGERPLTILEALAAEVERQPWTKKLELLGSAKIPVLKMTYSLDPTQQDVLLDLTHLVSNDLNCAFSGGISSYVLVILVIRFLQPKWCYTFYRGGRVTWRTGIGSLLILFLETYITFDYRRFGVSIDKEGEYFLLPPDKVTPMQCSAVIPYVSDPIKPGRSICNCFRMHENLAAGVPVAVCVGNGSSR
uniref:C3H1-type domain-containing protein n=1 Tax=Phytophthora ramorum TaxID=164328 RepID=H3HBW9_PHYRM